ncbi:MAG: Holliday junction branch migration protein RuvA [Clostridiales bacterium]|nr:Holliday junction branch migration protein RuvA [Clostridiales bacterium]
MFDFIEGEIIAKGLQGMVIKTGGIGFSVKVSNQTLSSTPQPGNKVTLYTSMQIREDDISLYGFSTQDERAFFEMLILVSGVGAKLALSILSAYPIPTLKKALVMGDVPSLTSISGIGKKTAERMILELKDKLGKDTLFGDGAEGFGGQAGTGLDDDVSQAIEALEALGYSRGEVIKAFAGQDLDGMEVEAIIRLGLKALARY